MNQQYLFLILLAVAFVALIVLPGRQRRRVQAQTQQMQQSLKPGTEVMTTSGIHGTVSRLTDTTVVVEIAPGVPVTFERRAIMQVVQPSAGTDGGATQAGLDTPGVDTPGLDTPGDDTPGDGTAGPTR
jgi:preprotein translocase subunit YajC